VGNCTSLLLLLRGCEAVSSLFRSHKTAALVQVPNYKLPVCRNEDTPLAFSFDLMRRGSVATGSISCQAGVPVPIEFICTCCICVAYLRICVRPFMWVWFERFLNLSYRCPALFGVIVEFVAGLVFTRMCICNRVSGRFFCHSKTLVRRVYSNGRSTCRRR
jgi:hypothetical protein